MPKVYRVEHKDTGKGPYHVGCEMWKYDDDSHMAKFLEEMAAAHQGEEHPDSSEDGIIGHHSGEVYGCASVKALKEWFKDFLPGLLEYGFQIVEYTVPRGAIRKGAKQVLFNKREFSARRVVESS